MKKRKPKKLPPRYILALQKHPRFFWLSVCGGCELITAFGKQLPFTNGCFRPEAICGMTNNSYKQKAIRSGSEPARTPCELIT